MNASRRQFLRRTGWIAGGVTVLAASGCSVLPVLPTFGESEQQDILAWVQMRADGTIRFYLPRAELGQGISTGLSQVVAEELHVPLARIDCRYQSTAVMAPCQMTVGSQSVENYLDLTAKAAAFLRLTMQARAAQTLRVDIGRVESIAGGFATEDGRSVNYEALVGNDEALLEPLTFGPDVLLRSQRKPSELQVVGKHVEPVNIRSIVTGAETYSRDVDLKGMLFGAVARPPQLGASHQGFDRQAALAISGVKAVVEHDEQIGVVAITPMAATQAITALAVQWVPLADEQLAKVQKPLDIDAFISSDELDHTPIHEGSVTKAAASATTTFSWRYDSPMVAHAAMEPRSGVAAWRQDKSGQSICEVWTGSQDPWMVQAAVAKALGISKSQVTVHNQRVGGGFGGRVLCQASVEAAWLSKAVGEPVKVQWSREEEFCHNYVGPQYSTRINTGLDANGRISHWHHQAVGAPILTSSKFLPPTLHWMANQIADPGTRRGMALPYSVQDHRVDFADERVPMPTGPWRGLGAAPNGFAIECAMDELSIAADADAIEFRLKHTSSPRLTKCLRRLQALLGDRSGSMGIAAAIYKEVTFVAIAVQVAVLDGKPQVIDMVCVHDCGRIIAPDQVRAQIEGNLTWGIGMALHERFELANGLGETDNFDRYALPRQVDVPDMTIDLIDSDEAPSGAAEASLAPVAAAVANAVSRLTGVRHRQLPLSRV